MNIYCIENKIDGKKYVGKTKGSIDSRFEGHKRLARRNPSTHLYKAMKKYGEDAFRVYLLEGNLDKNTLNDREMYWIKTLNTKSLGYNETEGGEGSFGRVATPEYRKRISDIMKERYKNDPTLKQKTSDATKQGMKKWWESLSEDEKNDYIERCQKRPEGYKKPSFTMSEETKRKISNSHKGVKRGPMSDETKQKLSASKLNNKEKYLGTNNVMSNPEIREKQRLACIGRKKQYREDGTWYWKKAS
jgi:group I intron endonuclease